VGLLRTLADNRSERSLAHRLRRRRFALFAGLLDRVPRPWRLVDVGGTSDYWERMHFRPPPGCEIVIVNVDAEARELAPGMRSAPGDGTRLDGIADREFDVAFSNSVIEHVGDLEAQRCMASEMRRIAPRYYVQTPDFRFPIEPHFLFPALHWMPERVAVEIVHRVRPGFYGSAVRSRDDASAVVRSIRLLTRRELTALFPDARIVTERIVGYPNSLVALAGRD
jgi:hypothetical protein